MIRQRGRKSVNMTKHNESKIYFQWKHQHCCFFLSDSFNVSSDRNMLQSWNFVQRQVAAALPQQALQHTHTHTQSTVGGPQPAGDLSGEGEITGPRKTNKNKDGEQYRTKTKTKTNVRSERQKNPQLRYKTRCAVMKWQSRGESMKRKIKSRNHYELQPEITAVAAHRRTDSFLWRVCPSLLHQQEIWVVSSSCAKGVSADLRDLPHNLWIMSAWLEAHSSNIQTHKSKNEIRYMDL